MQKYILTCLLLLALNCTAQNIIISNGTYIKILSNTNLIQSNNTANSITNAANPFYEYSFFVSYTSTPTQRVVTVVVKAYY